MPSGPNVDLGNDLVVQGLSASSLNAYLVPPTDVTQYKSIMLMIKNNAFVGTSSNLPPAMVTAFEIPTAGCWELTAHYRGHTLMFITSVKP